MSHTPLTPPVHSRLSIPKFQALKNTQPIVCLTAYSAPMAALLDDAVDMLLIGDSLGMVLYGMESTLPVTLELMIAHGKAVASHSKQALTVIDMPFGSYQESPQQAFRNASRLLQETGAIAVKLEGGLEMTDTITFLVARGIPVMAHIGLKPQHVHTMGGYKTQGKNEAQSTRLLEEARAMEEAGAFALLLEGIVDQTAQHITQAATIPTIGIGASAACDGQVLVTEDMLGLHDRTPRFVKQYADLRTIIRDAAQSYASEVKNRQFPAAEHSFTAPSATKAKPKKVS